MMMFSECGVLMRMIIGVGSIFAVYGAILTVALTVKHGRFVKLVVLLPVLACSLVILECVLEYQDYLFHNGITDMSPRELEFLLDFGRVPFATLAFLCLICLSAEAGELISMSIWERTHITPASVKEAIDSMPRGVCCFKPGGRILLVNRSMEQFCRKVTGDVLADGESFEQKLFTGELQPGLKREQLGDKPVILSDDGTAYFVSAQTVMDGKNLVRVLYMSDMTEEYRKTMDLLEYQVKVKELNERLTRYNSEIVALASDREVLNAKVKIHDEMGSGLLAIKHYLKTGGTEEEKENIIGRLRRNIAFLQHETEENVTDEYALMIGTAEELGVSIEIDGELPQDEPLKHIVAMAIHECLTNTLRHARGDRIHISVTDTGDDVEVILKNNGRQPDQEITERGGLASLRVLTEQSGGRMEVISMPEFAVVLSLPKGELIYAV